MDRAAQLVLASSVLRRRLFAALPLYVRFAHILVANVVDQSASAVNQVVAAALIAAGVHDGMPPINGMTVTEYAAKKVPGKEPGKDRDAIFAHLVKDPALMKYGNRWIGTKALAIARAVVKVESRIPDLLQNFLARFFTSTMHHLDAKFNAHQAVDFAVEPIRGMALNEYKVEKREKQRGGPMTVKDDEGGEKELELADKAHDLEGLVDKLDNKVVQQVLTDPQVQHELNAEHPDAVQYIHLHMQDYEDVEILGMDARGREVGTPMLKHPFTKMKKRLTPQNFTSIKDKFFDILHKHIHAIVHKHEHAVMASVDDPFGAPDPDVDYSALGVSPFAA